MNDKGVVVDSHEELANLKRKIINISMVDRNTKAGRYALTCCIDCIDAGQWYNIYSYQMILTISLYKSFDEWCEIEAQVACRLFYGSRGREREIKCFHLSLKKTYLLTRI